MNKFYYGTGFTLHSLLLYRHTSESSVLCKRKRETPAKIPYISGNGNLKILPIFQEVTFQAQKIKKKIISQETELSYISGNGTF